MIVNDINMKFIKFQMMVVNDLFLSKRARPYKNPMNVVFAKRIISPNIIYRKKLVRVLKYLNGTRVYHLALIIDDTRLIKW